MMGILFTFFVILGFSVANGFAFVGYEYPKNIESIVAFSLIITGSLILYWWISRNWEKPDGEWDNGGHHARPFCFMFGLSLAVAVLSLLTLVMSYYSTTSSLNSNEIQILTIVLVASISATISYGIASLRERKYADGILFKS